VRVWRTARTEEQIRAGMFQTLTGTEPGLAALWNFADGTARDVSPTGAMASLPSGANGRRRLPAPESLSVLHGRLLNRRDGPKAPIYYAFIRIREPASRCARSR